MGTKVCFNSLCGKTTSEWRNGWVLRSGRLADLCDTCGSAYDEMRFCEEFHFDDAGWRPCNECNKQVHCGCIASNNLYVLLDGGGIECINCCRNNTTASAEASSWKQPPEVERSKATDPLIENIVDGLTCGSGLGKIDKDMLERTRNKSSEHDSHEDSGHISYVREPMEDMNDTDSGRIELVQRNISMHDKNNRNMHDLDLLTCVEGSLENIKDREEFIGFDTSKACAANEAFGMPANACLNISLGPSTLNGAVESSNNSTISMLGLVVSSGSPGEAKEQIQNKFPATHLQHQQPCQLLPKPTHTSPSTGSESSKDTLPQIRIARPPGEGRGRNQLLPRYWPRITDQELQQISGDSNSTIIPLFEKVLSASDAGRIGRLVLPKACAEAYFPPISQPEGVPLKIQDEKGKDWVFQFRFWPNNNSRMYVLEGVTPCIQSMQLQAGDTVTFSRLDPEGKLVMGFRKASSSASAQEGQTSVTGNGISLNGVFHTGGFENFSGLNGFSGLLLQSMKGNGESHVNTLADHLNPSDEDFSLHKSNKIGGQPEEGSVFQSFPQPDKKISFNIGTKSKRLRMDNEDALELKLTWEEAQDLLHPPPKVVPSVVIIEDHEFEEYEEPPVFGKRTFFTSNQFGEQDQWAQCDYCYSWRRLPVDAFLPARWTCAENTSDPKRASCSALQEISPKELEDLLQHTTDARREDACEGKKVSEASSALDTLANAAVLGENASPSPAPTTKHPRHRPGCTCIVCIQPPSGKGPKHKPTCTCNVCMTVKRRFKTLMMRRKKRQSEQEAENARKNLIWGNDDSDFNSEPNYQSDVHPFPENTSKQENASLAFREIDPGINNNLGVGTKLQTDLNLKGECRGFGIRKENNAMKAQIDLNSQPEREEEPTTNCVSMLKLLQDASLPLDMYLEEQGLTSLICPQQVSNPAVGLQRVEAEQQTDEQTFIHPSQTSDCKMEQQLYASKKMSSTSASPSIQVPNQT